MHVGKLLKVILDFLYAMKLVPLDDLRLKFKVSKCWKLFMQILYDFLVIGDASGGSGAS